MFQKTKRSVLWIPQKRKQQYAGIHLIAEFWHGKDVKNPKELKRILITAAKKAKNIPLKVSIYKFSPQGITGVILLAESHIALHNWPEINYLAIDIFTCGCKAMPHKALEYLRKEFNPEKVEIKEIKRGIGFGRKY
jgi:S-adenosylmethionine decarboxylase